MEIISKLDKETTFRIVRPKDGNTMEEVSVVRNRDTGERRYETRDLPDHPAPTELDRTVAASEPRFANDAARFDDFRQRKLEDFTDPNREPDNVDEDPDITKWLQDQEGINEYAKTDRVSFTGLGGILGPKGRLGKKD